MEPQDIPLYGKIARLPIIRNLMVHPYFKTFALAAIGKFSKDTKTKDLGQSHEVSVIVGQAANWQFRHHPGFFRAAIRTVIDYPLGGLHKRYAQVGSQPERPVLLVWGDADIVSFIRRIRRKRVGSRKEKKRKEKKIDRNNEMYMHLNCINNKIL
jgi:hypothetical protein